MATAISKNYVVTLTTTDKEQTVGALSLVVASPQFSTTFTDSKQVLYTFTGILSPEESGTILVEYVLTGSVAVSQPPSFQYKAFSTKASVRLKLAEPIQILKDDTRVSTLSISRLSERDDKSK